MAPRGGTELISTARSICSVALGVVAGICIFTALATVLHVSSNGTPATEDALRKQNDEVNTGEKNGISGKVNAVPKVNADMYDLVEKVKSEVMSGLKSEQYSHNGAKLTLESRALESASDVVSGISSPSMLLYSPRRDEVLLEGSPKFEVIHNGGEKVRVPPGPRPTFDPGVDSSQIFVGIASFRDKECSGTLLSMYEKAKFPDRVFVGLIQQIDADVLEEDCLYMCREEGANSLSPEMKERAFKHLCPAIKDRRITDVRIPYLHGKGVMYARHNVQWLLQNQEFALMIDAHSEFEVLTSDICKPDWDSLMIANWNEIENEMAIISTYPKNFKDRTQPETWDRSPTIPQLCRSAFKANGVPRHQSAVEVSTRTSHLSPFWGACLSFSKAHAWRRCTFDPYTYFAFDPEEFSYGIRLWTHGYDFYTPSYNYVYHQYYGDELARKFGKKREFYFTSKTFKAKAVAHVDARIRHIIGNKKKRGREEPDLREISHYSLGDVRTLDEYLRFTSIDIEKQEAPNICEKVWKDELELVPLHYIPDLSGVLKGPYQDNWFDPSAED